MGNKKKSRRPPPGSAPGVLTIDPTAVKSVIRVLSYGPAGYVERTLAALGELDGLCGVHPVTWVNVDGLGDNAVLAELARIYHLHPLAVADVANVPQRAKVEVYGDQLFIVSRMIERRASLEAEQLSIFVGKNFVLTFQETHGDCFDPIRARIRGGSGRIRGAGPDYLAWALLDAVVDYYFPVLEAYSERLEVLEDKLLARPDPDLVAKIHRVRRDLLMMRRSIWPMREAIGVLYRDPLPLIADETRLYFRDCHDHTTQIIDLLETNRELGADLTELYLSSISNRLNEVMKVLAIIATIFMPLSFIAGVYGMNFHVLPELHWRYGYPFALALMAATAGFMIWWFWRRGWFDAIGSHRVAPGAKKNDGESG